MDYTKFTFDELKYELDKKQQELLMESINVFTLNPHVAELAKEIKDLQAEIDKREG